MAQQKKATDVLIGSAVYGFVKAGIAAGLTPTQSCTVAAWGIIEGTLGREFTKALGIPRSTMSDWRRLLADIAEGFELVDDPQLEVDFLNELLPVIGMRDLRLTREVPSDQPPSD